MENDPAIHGLLRRRSEIAGSIVHLEAQVSNLRADLLHVDATLRIMGHLGDEVALPVRKACTSGLFHRKELTRLVTSHLRSAPNGMSAVELALTISRDKGWDTDDRRFQVSLTDKMSRCLSRLKVQGHTIFEDREDGYMWRLTPPAANIRPTRATPDD